MKLIKQKLRSLFPELGEANNHRSTSTKGTLVFESLFHLSFYISVLAVNLNYYPEKRLTISGIISIFIVSVLALTTFLTKFGCTHRRKGDEYFRALQIVFSHYLFIAACDHLFKMNYQRFRTQVLIALVTNYSLSTGILNSYTQQPNTLMITQIVLISIILQLISFRNETEFEELKDQPEDCLNTCSLISNLLNLAASILLFKIKEGNHYEVVFERGKCDSNLGICVAKENKIVFSNKAMDQIFSCNKVGDSAPARFMYINSLCFLNYEEEMPFPEEMRQRGKLTKQTLSECFDHLKRNPLTELTFYVIIEDAGSSSNCAALFSTSNENPFELGVYLPYQPKKYEVRISYFDSGLADDESIVLKFLDYTKAVGFYEKIGHSKNIRLILENLSKEIEIPLKISQKMLDKIQICDPQSEVDANKCILTARSGLEIIDYFRNDVEGLINNKFNRPRPETSEFSIIELIKEILLSFENFCLEQSVKIDLDITDALNVRIKSNRQKLRKIFTYILYHYAKIQKNVKMTIKLCKKGESELLFDFTCKTYSDNNTSLEKDYPLENLQQRFNNEFELKLSNFLLKDLNEEGIKRCSFKKNCDDSLWLKFICSSVPDNSGGSPCLDSRYKTEAPMLSTKFSVSLDLAINKSHSNRLGKKPKKDNKSCSTNALIVSDDVFNIISLELLLENLGIKGIKAFNWSESLKVVNNLRNVHICDEIKCIGIKLILMDITFPIMNGIECAKIMRLMMKNNEIPYIPIIACTNNDSKVILSQCKSFEFDDIIDKPLISRQFKERISTLL